MLRTTTVYMHRQCSHATSQLFRGRHSEAENGMYSAASVHGCTRVEPRCCLSVLTWDGAVLRAASTSGSSLGVPRPFRSCSNLRSPSRMWTGQAVTV